MDIGKMLYELQVKNNMIDPTDTPIEVDGKELTKEEKQKKLKEYKDKNNLK